MDSKSSRATLMVAMAHRSRFLLASVVFLATTTTYAQGLLQFTGPFGQMVAPDDGLVSDLSDRCLLRYIPIQLGDTLYVTVIGRCRGASGARLTKISSRPLTWEVEIARELGDGKRLEPFTTTVTEKLDASQPRPRRIALRDSRGLHRVRVRDLNALEESSALKARNQGQ